MTITGRPALADDAAPRAPAQGGNAIADGAPPALPPDEAESARGHPIVDVTIAGNRRIPDEEIAKTLQSLRRGNPFTPEGLAGDVHELWKSGYFEDIEVSLTLRDGVRLRMLVHERPGIKAIELSGNKEIGDDDLLEALSTEVKSGSILSYPALDRGVQKLRDKYAEQGYLRAEIAYEVVPQRDNQVVLRLEIREHKRVTVRRITFIGNAHIPSSELRDVMLTGQKSLLDLWAGAPFRQDVFERDLLAVTALYYDRGFLSVQLDTPRVAMTTDGEGVELSVSINEGPRYRVRALRVEELDADRRAIEPLGGRRHLREMVRARAGDYFNRAELARDLAAIQRMYRDAGYANVEVNPTTQLDPEKQEVELAVEIRRHDPVRIGRIEIRGNTKTHDKVVRREIELNEGDLFSEAKLARSKQRITALGYFERVDVSTAQGEDPRQIDINVDVVEKPTGTFQIGAGFSSIEKFLLNAQVQQSNLLGTGTSLALQAQISGVRQLLDLRFADPYFLDTRLSLGVDLYNQLRSYEQFEQASRGGSVTFGYPLSDPDLRLALTYTLQSDRVSPQSRPSGLGTSDARSTFQRLPISSLFNVGLTSSVRSTITYDTRNNQLFPSSGVFLQGSAELATPLLGSENEFVRYRATGRFYYPLTSDNAFVLKLNSEAGLVTSPRPEGVPIFNRFYLGGISDVRGFPVRSVGPRLPLRQSLDENSLPIQNGANIGGNLIYYQNLELEFPILSALNLRGVLFTDLGNAWNLEPKYCRAASGASPSVTNPCFSPTDLLRVRASAGFGVRWRSPLGLLRFEWGFPLRRLPYEKRSLFEFTIGGAF
jgi:outer membrane protein insertion porin family